MKIGKILRSTKHIYQSKFSYKADKILDLYSMRGINEKIDKLTNSIENAYTGERFLTDVLVVLIDDIVEQEWLFDWKAELDNPNRKVFKLITRGNENIIQGLMSINNGGDHIFLYLIESPKFNKGKSKQYLGVVGNLFAYACKYSFELGYDGFVAFDSKSSLKQHYIEILGAKILFGNRMLIETREALKLINQYYNE